MAPKKEFKEEEDAAAAATEPLLVSALYAPGGRAKARATHARRTCAKRAQRGGGALRCAARARIWRRMPRIARRTALFSRGAR
jgi:hypothetical protein